MAYQIVWPAEAENDFKNIILYLKENWSLQSSEKFIERTYRRLERLADMPSAARTTSTINSYLQTRQKECIILYSRRRSSGSAKHLSF